MHVAAVLIICILTVSGLEITGIMIEALGVALVHSDILAILPLLSALYSLLLTKYFASIHAHVDTIDFKFFAAWHTKPTSSHIWSLIHRVIEAGKSVGLVGAWIKQYLLVRADS